MGEKLLVFTGKSRGLARQCFQVSVCGERGEQ